MTGSERSSLSEIFLVFLRLGCTSFGGPIAHLGYFHSEFVTRRRWVDASTYADLVALCQFLPGPASSQVGLALGLGRGGYAGALVAWAGFTLPSALLLTAFGIGLFHFSSYLPGGMLHGFKLAAVVVVAQALWGMATQLCPDRERIGIAIIAAVLAAIFPSIIGQLAGILLGAVTGSLIRTRQSDEIPSHDRMGNRTVAVISIVAFLTLLILLPLAATMSGRNDLRLIDVFYRAGSLVFGGGHVVLPLLQSEIVATGLVSRDAFLAGYGVAQAIPGPLFTIAAYLGAVSTLEPNGFAGATLCLLSIFLPGALLVFGILPFWESLRKHTMVRRSVAGINAAVVGLLLLAFYDPVWVSAITAPKDFLIAGVGYVLLAFWRIPSWGIVGLCAIAGTLL